MSTKENKEVQLEVGGVFQLESGAVVHVVGELPGSICSDNDAKYIGAFNSDDSVTGVKLMRYYRNGMPLHDDYTTYRLHSYDPLTALQINAPVLASISGKGRLKTHHFAGVENGVAYVWEEGKTSFTTNQRVPVKSIRIRQEDIPV